MDKIRLYFWRNLKFKSSVPQLPALSMGNLLNFPEHECKIFIITLGEKDTSHSSSSSMWKYS